MVATLLVLGTVFLVSAFSLSGEGEPLPYDGDLYALDEASIFTYSNVVIISSVEGEDAVTELSSNVRVQETFDGIEGTDVVIIESAYAGSLGTDYLYSNVDALILGSHPVILKGADTPWIFAGRDVQVVSIGFSPDKEDLYCLFYNSKTGASSGNSISGCDMNESVGVAYKWAKELTDEFETAGFGSAGL
ncbi:MAG: hypothetical protein LBJ20_04710 [Candidatus Methanoplasma sp.]|jgi:hypothetical protein|nr:hypothetical protein [Candidatus Methanoplasma sp.]